MELPHLTSAPGIGGTIKARPTDFFVQELSDDEATGDGEHVLFEIRKVGITTDEAVRRIANALRLDPRNIGTAGRKDKWAVTQQRMTALGARDSQVMALQADDLQVLWAAHHRKKLHAGHLSGNRFAVIVRNVNPTDVVKLRPVLNELIERGMPNYFGPQRFGKYGDNAERGFELLRAGEQAIRKTPRSKREMLVSAAQSAVFNAVVAERIRQGIFDKLIPGDVAKKTDTGGCFVVEDVEKEQPRCANWEISPAGPLPGPKLLAAKAEALALEQKVFAEFGVKPEDFAAAGRSFPGERRAIRVRPEQTELAGGVDDFGPQITVAFNLPKGSYATTLMRELLKVDDMEKRDDRGPIEGLQPRVGAPDGKV
ncbi:MAG: tRNA pseudouridine(13) synthase TruD [Planctomycetota bacterium]